MLGMFTEETIMYPKESAWFQSLDPTGKYTLPLNGTTFYQEDFIGLKELVDAGKVQFISIEGDHLEFTEEDIKNTFIPFLNQ